MSRTPHGATGSPGSWGPVSAHLWSRSLCRQGRSPAAPGTAHPPPRCGVLAPCTQMSGAPEWAQVACVPGPQGRSAAVEVTRSHSAELGSGLWVLPPAVRVLEGCREQAGGPGGLQGTGWGWRVLRPAGAGTRRTWSRDSIPGEQARGGRGGGAGPRCDRQTWGAGWSGAASGCRFRDGGCQGVDVSPPPASLGLTAGAMWAPWGARLGLTPPPPSGAWHHGPPLAAPEGHVPPPWTVSHPGYGLPTQGCWAPAGLLIAAGGGGVGDFLQGSLTSEVGPPP